MIDIQDHYKSSTMAFVERDRLLRAITNTRFKECGWRKGYVDYVTHIFHLLHKYNTLCDGSHVTPIDEDMQMRHIKNAVQDVPKLNQIKLDSQKEVIYGRSPITPEKYRTLLISQATVLDESCHGKSKSSCNISAHFFDVDDVEYDSDGVDLDNIAEDSVYELNVTRRPRRPSMGKANWDQLLKDQQALWDQLDDAAKAIILGQKSLVDPKKTPVTGGILKNTARSVNVSSSEEQDDAPALECTTSNDSSDQEGSPLCAKIHKQAEAKKKKAVQFNKTSPAGIRKVLASQKKTSSSLANSAVFHVNVAKTTYMVTNTSPTWFTG